MNMRFQALVFAALVPLAGVSCTKVQAKSAFKDGNKEYKDENFKRAIEDYEKAVKLDPRFAEAWFYLGSSYQALYRPGKDSPENKAYLEKAVEAYKKALELNDGSSENLKKVKRNTLAALTAIYSDEPYRNFETANGYAQQLVQEDPDDPKNLYALANLYEKFGKVDLAEQTYQKVWKDSEQAYRQLNDNAPPPSPPVSEASPSPAFQALDQATKSCGALAAFYNKPLWDDQGNTWVEGSDKPRRSKFDQAIEVLQNCTALKPDDHEGYLKIATFFWDKAYRDPSLTDEQKRHYADKGMEAVDKALALKPDYFEAIIFKGLLFRVKATVEQNPRLRQQYLDQAATLQKQGLELKKQQAAESAASPSPGS